MADTAPTDRAIGICLGASTISAVRLRRLPEGSCAHPPADVDVEQIILKPHEGNPRKAFENVLAALNTDGLPILVTGRKFRTLLSAESITEPEAIEHALAFLRQKENACFDTVISAGGETFIVYALDHAQKIAGLATGNKCASGTGEFFLQQIRRMDLGLEQAVEYALQGEPYHVSGRCSVFCKSDCTHALNKGERIENVTAGLCKMIAKKILEIVERFPHEKVCVIGGTALNTSVIGFLREKIPNVTVPQQAPYFEALGAALAAFGRGRTLSKDIYLTGASGFSFLQPLKQFHDLVSFGTLSFEKAGQADRCIVGLDVGSTTTKAVLMRTTDHALLASVYLRTNGNPIAASRECFKKIQPQISGVEVEIIGIGVTGSGRHIAGLYAGTDGIINEIIAHAAAAVYFDPDVDTIFEIGGQDAKYTHITGGVASDYAMNEACSAGTGSFLEEAACESLGVSTKEIADMALAGEHPPNFNDQCAAFISSDIKNATHEGIGRNDILAGLVYSICFNYNNRVKGSRPVGKKIFMQGGVCYNRAVPLAMAGILQKPIMVPPEPGLMGAFGVALELKKRLALGLLCETSHDLDRIIAHEVTHEAPFVCAGGREKCDLKCSIARIRIGDKLFPFGGACNRYYSRQEKDKTKENAVDYVKTRNELMFGKYAPARPAASGAPVIGINTSFLTLSLFPLYYNFFSLLGAAIVMPDEVAEDAANHLVTSMCYPAEIAIGLYKNLVTKNPDYIFMPFVKELYVPNGIKKHDFCSTCGFSRGEGFYIKQAFRKNGRAKILTPYLNFNKGWEHGERALIRTAVTMGFPKKEAERAYAKAVTLQYSFEEEMRIIGKDILSKLAQEPDSFAVVLFGRSYNAFAPEANKGIPVKFSSRGVIIIPFQMLPCDELPVPGEYSRSMHWEAGQRILRAAQAVKDNPQLFGVFITNFLCAPDSFLVPYFRRIMGTKPSLTLELDAHTADAGINTRIDAYLDILHNWQKVQKNIVEAKNDFRIARISFEHHGAFFVDSDDRRFRFSDKGVKILLPSIGEYGSQALAAVFRGLGMGCEALPPSDNETLNLGRSVTTGKECMPLIICIGGLLKYLRDNRPHEHGEKIMLFLPEAAGHCRLGQYHIFLSNLLRELRIKDVAPLNLSLDGKFAGMGPVVLYNAWKAVLVADVMDDILCSLLALASRPDEAVEIFRREFYSICDSLEGKGKKFYAQLHESALRLRTIPLTQSFDETAHIAVTGEFYVRRDSFANLGLAHRLAREGFLVTTAALAEVMYYISFMIRKKIKNPDRTISGWLEFIISDKTQRHVEKKIKSILSLSGLYHSELVDIDDMIRYSEYAVPHELDGEAGLIAGLTMRDALSKYSGIVNVGPFGCMQTRFGDAVTAPLADVKGKRSAYSHVGEKLDLPGFCDDDRIPFLSVESDGNPYPQLLEARFESFCLQARRVAEKQGKRLGRGSRALTV